MEAELDGAEEGGVKTDADDEETRKLLQKDLVVDRFTRAELHYRKVVTNTNCACGKSLVISRHNKLCCLSGVSLYMGCVLCVCLYVCICLANCL